MANVTIEINNREFLIACADGDEKIYNDNDVIPKF